MASPSTLELQVFTDYDPNNPKKKDSPAQKLATAILHTSASSSSVEVEPLKSRVVPLPSIVSIKEAAQNPSTADLSASLIRLRSVDWSPDDLAQKLLENEEIRENFEDAEKLAKILNDLKQLDNHLKEVGCPDLQEFLTSLVPNKDDDWVIIPKNEHKKSWFSYIKTGVYNGYYVGKKLSEVRGVAVGTISTTIWLLKSPAGKAVAKALIALVI